MSLLHANGLAAAQTNHTCGMYNKTVQIHAFAPCSFLGCRVRVAVQHSLGHRTEGPIKTISVVRCQAYPADTAPSPNDVDQQQHLQQSGLSDVKRPARNHDDRRTVTLLPSRLGEQHRCHSTTGRRELLLHSSLAPLLIPLLLGSDDATTIVNSVLSAYGLPTFKASPGFKLYDEFNDDFTFEYPRSWVARRNTLRKGVYISDYQTADKVSVEELDTPADGDLATAAVAAAVYPGGNRLVEDATLTLPAKRLIKAVSETVDGYNIVYLEFPSETITRSGYNIRRKNFAAAAVKRDKLYTIAASARSGQFNEDKKQLLQHIIRSFRLR